MSHEFVDKTREKLEILKKRGINPKKVADIGANIGQFYSLFKEIFPDSEILSIEGNPNCEVDLKSINPNYLISLLGSDESEKKFYINKNYDKCTGSSIYKESTEFYTDCDVMTLNSVKLDSLNLDFDLIKIDVQGSELDILKGGQKTLLKCDYLLIELSIKEYNEGGSLAGDVVCFLNNIGFKMYDVLSQFYFKGELTQIDILFVNLDKNRNALKV